LEYLERLALLPECQVVDPKSIVNENELQQQQQQQTAGFVEQQDNMQLTQQQQQQHQITHQQPTGRVNNNKRNLATANNTDQLANDGLNSVVGNGSAKKVCSTSSSNSNSPISGAKYANHSTSQQQYQNSNNEFINHRYTNILNDSSPSSTCSTASSSGYSSSASSSNSASANTSLAALNSNPSSASMINTSGLSGASGQSNNNNNNNNNNNDSLVSANLIDACNFDFLDFLPELSSSALDSAINDVAASIGASSTAPASQYYSGELPNQNEFGYNQF
jgi:hypothetical protein